MVQSVGLYRWFMFYTVELDLFEAIAISWKWVHFIILFAVVRWVFICNWCTCSTDVTSSNFMWRLILGHSNLHFCCAAGLFKLLLIFGQLIPPLSIANHDIADHDEGKHDESADCKSDHLSATQTIFVIRFTFCVTYARKKRDCKNGAYLF